MDPLVFLQVTRLGEVLVTVGAGKGLIFIMCPHMYFQVTTAGERLVTAGAGKDFTSMGISLG